MYVNLLTLIYLFHLETRFSLVFLLPLMYLFENVDVDMLNLLKKISRSSIPCSILQARVDGFIIAYLFNRLLKLLVKAPSRRLVLNQTHPHAHSVSLKKLVK